jgi:hypothetical protein
VCAAQVLGGGGALWQAPPGEVMASVFPNIGTVLFALSAANAPLATNHATRCIAHLQCSCFQTGFGPSTLTPTRAIGIHGVEVRRTCDPITCLSGVSSLLTVVAINSATMLQARLQRGCGAIKGQCGTVPPRRGLLNSTVLVASWV